MFLLSINIYIGRAYDSHTYNRLKITLNSIITFLILTPMCYSNNSVYLELFFLEYFMNL